MKKLILCAAIAAAGSSLQAQGLKSIIKQPASQQTASRDSSGKGSIAGVLKKATGAKTGLSNDEIVAGLKEALNVGTDKAAQKVSAADGFFKDAAIKILMPAEAKKVETKLRNIGMGKQVDNAILSMNRAAEDAAKSAAPIFAKAIKGMSFQDALAILKGHDAAATGYLKDKTAAALTEAFRPVIESSLQKTGATKHWNTVFTTYNKFSTEQVETDLSAYVTEKALTGIFFQLSEEEKKIRKDPVARTTDLLKKVFAN